MRLPSCLFALPSPAQPSPGMCMGSLLKSILEELHSSKCCELAWSLQALEEEEAEAAAK